MGNTPSSQVEDGSRHGSRDISPLNSGDEDGGLEKIETHGLPIITSSPAPENQVTFSQSVDFLPTFSQPEQPAKKKKGSNKSHSRKSSETNHSGGPDAEVHENNGAATGHDAALARILRPQPESPEPPKSKKKKRRKSKTQDHEPTEDQPLQAAESLDIGGAPPEMAEAVEAAEVAEVAEAHEAPEAPEVPALEEEAAAPTATEDQAPSSEPLDTRKNKKKKKSKADSAEGPRLDLHEDPIAGSDEELAALSTEKSSRRRKSHHDDVGSSRKFRKKRASIPPVSLEVIESTQDEAASGALASSTAEAAPAPDAFLRRSKSRDPEPYQRGEDNISPSVTRQERRTRRASSRSASASLAEVHSPELVPVQAAEGDAMDIDAPEPRLNGSLDTAASEDGRGPPSDYSGDLPSHEDRDQVMEDEPQLPQLSRDGHASHQEPEGVDITSSTLRDSALMASTQPQPATDDNRSMSGPPIGTPVPPRVNGDGNGAGSDAATGDGDDTSNRKRSGRARATAKKSRMALPFVLDAAKDGQAASALDAAPETEASASAEVGRGPDSTQPTRVDNREEPTMSQLGTSQPDDSALVRKGQTAGTPRVKRSSANTTPRASHTYSSRKPKPSFFERSAEDTAHAFAELPSNEVAATPKPTKPKSKRRLPIDVPGDAEPGPEPSTKRRRSKKATKAAEEPEDPEPAKKTASSRKAPETATRNAAGYLTGQFTKTEAAQIEGAVHAFREYHNLEQYEVNAMVQENPKDVATKDKTLYEDLWKRVVEACPTRSRQKLINWSRQKFHNFVARATFTAEQDEELREMVQQHGKKWSVIGQLINRHQKDARDRWRNYLIADNKQSKNAWSDEEERQLVDILAEVLARFQGVRDTDPDSDLFRDNKTNEELIDWNIVAEKMHHTRTRLQCLEKWRRMREGNEIHGTVLAGMLGSDARWRLKRARADIATMSHADMYHVVLAISTLDGDAEKDADINWKAVLESQRKKYHRYTGMLLWSRLRQLVPGQEAKDVQECAKELITMYQSDGGTFAVPGNEAFDDAEEEEILAEVPPRRKRTTTTKKPKVGKGKESHDSAKRRVVSEEFVEDSEPDEQGDKAGDDGDSSRAEYNATSPAAPEPTELEPSQEDGGTREASVDLSNNAGAGHDERGASVDLAIADDNIDPELEQQLDVPSSPKPPKKKKKSKSKSKAEATANEKEVDQAPPSGAKRHKKRYSADMAVDLARQEGSETATGDGGGGGGDSRKRARGDDGDAGTPNGEASPKRKRKRARHASQVPQIEQQAEGAISSDDDMGDIPARLPRASTEA